MCSRFALTRAPDEVRRIFGYSEQPNFPARFNIAPTQPIAVVRAAREQGATPGRTSIVARHFALMRWAFVPGFVKNPNDFPLLFNARAESLDQKASFRNGMRRRRCLIPADAFYEWRRVGQGKNTMSRAYLARRVDSRTMGLAGLWETWVGPNGEEVDTACIVTTAANGVSAAIHPRLPVVIEERDFATWLEPDELAADEAAALLKTPDNAVLEFVPVGNAINKVGTEGPDLQMPIGAPIRAAEPKPPAQPSLF